MKKLTVYFDKPKEEEPKPPILPPQK